MLAPPHAPTGPPPAPKGYWDPYDGALGGPPGPPEQPREVARVFESKLPERASQTEQGNVRRWGKKESDLKGSASSSRSSAVLPKTGDPPPPPNPGQPITLDEKRDYGKEGILEPLEQVKVDDETLILPKGDLTSVLTSGALAAEEDEGKGYMDMQRRKKEYVQEIADLLECYNRHEQREQAV